MTILRDTLYSDKILAVLREYGSNAWDAHRMIGKNDLPIKITLPSSEDPTLRIRDYGPGMSPDEIFKTYTQYGESTKRGTNDAVGMMGIGSKSAFSYSDSFTVTCWNGGKQRIYVAVLDASNRGEMSCLDESDLEPDADGNFETGVEIQVPVRIEDIYDFKQKAVALFKYFDPQPDINIHLPKYDRKANNHGFVSSDMQEWVAVMGCIPYRLNLAQIQKELDDAGLWQPLQRIKGGIIFKIGDVAVSASREELKYSESTRQAIVDKFTDMVDEHVEQALADIRNANLSDWEKRVRANFMVHVVGFKLPKSFAKWAVNSVPLWGYKPTVNDDDIPVDEIEGDGDSAYDDVVDLVDAGVLVAPTITATTSLVSSVTGRVETPKTFNLFRSSRGMDAVHAIAITQGGNTRFIIRDDPRALSGFQFGHYDYVVRPLPDTTVDEVRTELEAYIKLAKLEGMPVKTITEAGINWYKPYEAPPEAARIKNPKHWTKAFKLKAGFTSMSHTQSDNWEPHSWTATDDDVYVALESFVPKSFAAGMTFTATVKADMDLAKWLGLDFPTIYGYKDTMSSPLKMSKVKGTEYKVWRAGFFPKAITSNSLALELYEATKWTSDKNGGNNYSSYYGDRIMRSVATMTEQLGPDHFMTIAMTKSAKACKVMLDNKAKIALVVDAMESVHMKTEASVVMARIQVDYPLLFKLVDLDDVCDRVTDWVQYIKTCDQAARFNAQMAATLEKTFHCTIDDLVEAISNDDLDSGGLQLDAAA